MPRHIATLALVVALALGWLTAGIATGETGSAKKRSTTVKTTLLEFQIKPKPTQARAGRVVFPAKNIGGVTHELVVVRSTGVPLPTGADGAVDESLIPTTDQFGEVVNVKRKQTKTLTVKSLEPGSYTLFCNLVDKLADGSLLSHYAKGMYTDFTVT